MRAVRNPSEGCPCAQLRGAQANASRRSGAVDDLDGVHCVILENDILVVDSRYVVKGRNDDPSDVRSMHILENDLLSAIRDT